MCYKSVLFVSIKADKILSLVKVKLESFCVVLCVI